MEFTYTKADDGRQDPGLTFGETTEFTATIGEAFSAPELTNPHSLAVTYTSENTDVATVDAANGAVTLVSAGTTTITAKTEGDETYGAGEASYTLTVVDNRAEAGLAYAEAEYTANIGEAFTAPALTNPNDLTVTYSSSVEEVAMVDEATGHIELMGMGTTVITAAFAGNATYKPGEASYTLKVVDPNFKGYKLATNISELTEGAKLLIVCTNHNLALGAISGTYGTAVNVTISNNMIEDKGDAVEITYQNGGLFNGTTYYTYTGSSNTLNTSDTPVAANITIATDGTATIPFGETGKRRLQLNATANPKRFACYTSDQQAVQIYVLEGSGSSTEKKDPELAFSKETVRLTKDATDAEIEAAMPTLTCAEGFDLSLVEWSSSNEAVAIHEGNTLLIGKYGKAIITASFAGNNEWNPATVTYVVEVLLPGGTEEQPYSVADALEMLADDASPEGVYVSGVITEVESFNATYGSITYLIADESGATSTLKIYGGLGLNGAKFAAETDLTVGAGVVVVGNLKNYYNTPEIDANSHIVKYTVAPVVTVKFELTESKTYLAELTCDNAEATIYYQVVKAGEAAQARAAAEGYTEYTEPFEVALGDKINYYAEVGNVKSEPTVMEVNNETTGIENVVVDGNGSAEYFDLTGRRVAQPENGVFIRRCGGKAAKVFVR